MVRLVDEHQARYGVEPICRQLPIAPSTYYEQKARERDPSRQPGASPSTAPASPALAPGGRRMRIWRAPLRQELADLVTVWAGDRTFCRPDFASLWEAKGGRPIVWVAEDGDGPAALLPAVEFGRGPWSRLQSMPDGCYGGLLAPPGREAAPGLGAALLRALAGHGYAKIFLADFYRTLPHAPDFRSRAARTTLVDIEDPAWQPPDPKLMSQVRKAEREGIRVVPFAWDRHAEGFLALARATERRHGRRRAFYPEAFYRRLADLAERSERIRWVICEHEGRPACSHIYVLEAGVLQGWHVVFDKAFSFLKPNQYIRLQMCRLMARDGIRRLNLGGTPENAPGVRSFKQRWGGQVVGYPVLERRRGLGLLP